MSNQPPATPQVAQSAIASLVNDLRVQQQVRPAPGLPPTNSPQQQVFMQRMLTAFQTVEQYENPVLQVGNS